MISQNYPRRHTSNHKTLMFFALFGLLLCGGLRQTCAQEFGAVERDRAKIMLGSVKNEIKKNYYDSTYHGVDVDARFKVAEEKLKQAASMGQVFGIIAQAVLDINDSHTIFWPPERAVAVEYGWQMQMIGDRCYVVAIKPGSDAETKLKVGDEVLAVSERQPTRDNLWKMLYLYYTLRPQPSLSLVVQSPGGTPRQVEVKAKVKQGKRRLDFTLSRGTMNDINDIIRDEENEARLHANRFVRVGESKDLFIWKMPEFDDPDLVDEMMGKAKESKALILDLRGNGGGAEVALLRLIGYFFDKDVKVGEIKRRKETKPLIAKTHDTYKGKLVVLVDNGSASASEVFARVIQLEKRGTIIGDGTKGAVMRAMFHPLQLGADVIVGYGVQVTDADLVMSDGKSLEGTGVTPDERKLQTGKDLAMNLDPVLAYAASSVGYQLTPEKAGSFFPVLWKKE